MDLTIEFEDASCKHACSVTFEWNALLDLSREAVTETLCSL